MRSSTRPGAASSAALPSASARARVITSVPARAPASTSALSINTRVCTAPSSWSQIRSTEPSRAAFSTIRTWASEWRSTWASDSPTSEG